ncbi:two-partner secretion domain-containing protein [Selenomonas ruminantium]|uniref:Filamentous hemagglutinin family N-terminal domain-containing protein n=1 Tax=Selenomonas ruminantium TaxID=971 RepID=A0A1H0Q2Y5_SELRU|nr:YDG domain-containing protein [Selenomonas ruminantium]SDP11066.1 filamentous hemagglutinin family N-terminal domain-containing protein [Selenomonas ruminantium]
MKRNDKLSRKARYGILAAIVAGAFSIMPAAQALPTGGASGTATITKSSGTTMDIASSVANNLLTWQDFSVAQGETVNFAGANNYLNVVLGSSRSDILGSITGSQAHIWLVNPNGILVGDGATINVGSLHLSTADISGNIANFTTPEAALSGVTQFKGDVVNKGTLTAAQDITVDGNNVTFKNVTNVTAGTTLTVKAASTDAFHVGRTDTTNLTLADGSTDPTYYKLISTAAELQAIKDDLSGNYMLAGDIECGSYENFATIGKTGEATGNPFTGKLDGLNYAIKDLSITVNTGAALFWGIKSASIENLVLQGGSRTAAGQRAAGIAAYINAPDAGGKASLVQNVYNLGCTVTSADASTGGLFGQVDAKSAVIKNVGNTADVTGKYVGGIAGSLRDVDAPGSGTAVSIENAYNQGKITASDGQSEYQVGGIVGLCEAENVTFTNVYNTGTINGNKEKSQTGGVIGKIANTGVTITNVYNTGEVTGKTYVGGIVGSNNRGTITKAYNTGKITGEYVYGNNNGVVGGIVGGNYGNLTNVYNTGDIKGGYGVGGIVGLNGSWDGESARVLTESSTIKNAYNTGKLTAVTAVGGIIGNDWTQMASGSIQNVSVENAYAAGEIVRESAEHSGGVVGIASRWGRGEIKNAYYIYGDDNGWGTKVSSAEDMQKLATFSAWGSDITSDGNSDTAAWRIYEGNTMPLLTAFLTPLELKDTTVTYDGQEHTLGNVAKLDATKILGGTLPSYTEVGDHSYSSLSSLYSNQHGYNIKASGDTATLTIAPIALELTASGYSKTYDGTTTATGGTSVVTKGNILGGVGGLTVQTVYSNKNAGTNKDMTASVTGLGSIYQVTTVSKDNAITAAPLTVTVTDASKQYDGTTELTNGAYTVTTGQLYGTDAVSGGTYAYADKNAGTGKTVSLTGLTVNDGNEGKNYELTVVNSTNSSITAAPLTLTVDDYSKEYDGTTSAPGATYSITTGQVFAGDSLSGGTFAFDDIEPGTGNTLTLSGVVVNDGNGGQNYEIPTYVPNTSASITVNTANAKVKLIDDRLADKGSSRSQIEGVTASPDSEPAAVNENSGNGKPQVQGKQTPVHDWDGEKVLTVENEGVNPPASMSAEEVASQEGK